jgi:hypothetical protein
LWSYWLGKDLIEYYIPNKMKVLQEKVCQVCAQHLNISVSAALSKFGNDKIWCFEHLTAECSFDPVHIIGLNINWFPLRPKPLLRCI